MHCDEHEEEDEDVNLAKLFARESNQSSTKMKKV